MPNLISSSTIVLSSYSPINPYSAAENLKMHLENRSHRYDLPPILDANGTIANYNSCFRVDTSNLYKPYVIGLDHKVSKMQHSIVLVQDQLEF